MAGKAQHAWPSDGELASLIGERGQDAAARWLGVSRSAVQHRIRVLKKRGVEVTAKQRDYSTPSAPRLWTPGAPAPEATDRGTASVRVDGNTVHVTLPSSEQPKLGDYETMLRERGLEPADWVVVSAKSNEWDAMTAVKRGEEPRTVRLRQWSIVLKPAMHKLFVMPAVHVPPVKRARVGPPASERPETIVVEGDHQVPYHDPALHEASLNMLADLEKHHRLAEHVFLGDTGDYPTISRHDDHPAAMAGPQEVVQKTYGVLREKCEAAKNVRRRKVKGNHDWRLESEQLKRAERLYGLSPAQRWEDVEEEIPALHLNRLLHLPELGIELVEDPRGWQHAEVELVPGPYGLVVRHGWLTGAKTAEASVKKRGRSIIVGHIHRREMAFVWDPSMQCERVGVVAGTMSLVRNERYPHFTTLDNWLQGCVIVTRWPDGDFQIDHVHWNGTDLRWRDKSWR